MEKADLGKRIRLIRQEKKIRLLELSKKTGYSKSFLSQIENNKVSPSVEALYRLSAALKNPISYFFEDIEENNNFVVKKDQRKKMLIEGDRIRFELLSSNLKNKKMEALIIRMKKGSISGEKTHTGEEVALVVQGKIRVSLDKKGYILKRGDSIYFQAIIPHQIENIGNSEAVLFWVLTPPSF